MVAGGVTSGNAAAIGLDNAVDHDPATLASVGTGAQYLQVDLGSEKTVNSLLVLRDNADMRTYKGVVYRLSASEDFSAGVTTVFHNDNDDLHGLGLGESTDSAYQETENGRTVRFAPVGARYLRLYSAGSNYDDTNRYREVLVGTAQAGAVAPSAKQRPATAARSGTGGGLARSATTTVKLHAAPASDGAPARQTRQVTPRQSSLSSLPAGDLTVSVSNQGSITALRGSDGNNYLASGYTPALLKLIITNLSTDAPGTAVQLLPTGATLSGNTLTLSFANSIQAQVRVVNNTDYLSLELIALTNPNNKDIRAALWGPYQLSIGDQVAQIAGVAYSRDFAIGIQAANPKTIGGAPYAYRSLTPGLTGAAGFPMPALATCSSWIIGCTGVVTSFGSILQAHSLDYSADRKLSIVPNKGERDVVAIEESSELSPLRNLTGSKIALFGVQRRGVEGGGLNRRQVFKKEILAVIHVIELGEGLPYTTGNGGLWAKFAEDSKQKIGEYGTTTLNDARSDALEVLNAGLDSIYFWNHSGGVYEHPGLSYSVKDHYGGNDAGLRRVMNLVRTEGVRWGNHTLPGFAQFDEPYQDYHARDAPLEAAISSRASDLVEKMRTTLVGAVDNNSDTITLAGRDKRLDETTDGEIHYNIGDEIISAADTMEVGGNNTRLTGVIRGDFGTRAKSHTDGATVRVLLRLRRL